MKNFISPLRNTYIEAHILQSFPAVCLNRDGMGSPKTAFVGGKTRIRVSSQCWKRANRELLRESGAAGGIRTKQLAAMIAAACADRGASAEQAASCGALIGGTLASNELFFVNPAEIGIIADWAKSKGFDLPASAKSKDKGKGKGRKSKAEDGAETAAPADDAGQKEEGAGELSKNAKTELVKLILEGDAGGYPLDIALYGRMAAQAQELSIEGAASFSHAITTHEAAQGFDYFTALDDLGEGPSSAHLGESEFASGTFYRYVSLDLGKLQENLGGESCGIEELQAAVRSVLTALYLAVPQARQGTMSGACLWDYARILVRKGQRMQLSFEKPVQAPRGGGWLAPSIEALNEGLKRHETGAGSLYGKIADVCYDATEGHGIDDACAAVRAAIAKAAA